MTRRLSWILVLILASLLAVVAAQAYRDRLSSGKGFPDYSVWSEDANGLAEAARFCRRLGYEPVALTRPIQQTRHRGLLILAEPTFTQPLVGREPGLSENDVRGLLRWVASGNTLLCGTRHHTLLHGTLHVSVTTDAKTTPEDVFPLPVSEAGVYTEEVRKVVVEGKNLLSTYRGLPLWWHGDRPGAVVLRHGQGRLLLLADASPLTARGLRRADNAVFLYNLARQHAKDGKIYFDEYHHGLASGGGFSGYLAYHQSSGVLLPLLLVVVVAGWNRVVRLGPAVETPRDQRADAVDYASAVARIHERAGARRPLTRALVQGFLTALTQHLHLRRNALPAEILAAWRHQHPGDTGEKLQALLRGVSQLRKGDISERQLLSWVRAFDGFVSSFRGRPRGGR